MLQCVWLKIGCNANGLGGRYCCEMRSQDSSVDAVEEIVRYLQMHAKMVRERALTNNYSAVALV